MVGVSYGGHCVYFKILIGTHAGGLLDWSPIRKARLSIVEPFVAKVAHVISINITHSLGDLGSRNSSV